MRSETENDTSGTLVGVSLSEQLQPHRARLLGDFTNAAVILIQNYDYFWSGLWYLLSTLLMWTLICDASHWARFGFRSMMVIANIATLRILAIRSVESVESKDSPSLLPSPSTA